MSKTVFSSLFKTSLLSVSLLGLMTLSAVLPFTSSVLPVIGKAEASSYNHYGFSPRSYKSGYNYGNGVYFAPFEFTIYENPSDTAEPIASFRWSRETATNSIDVLMPNGDRHAIYADHLFFCFYPDLEVAMLPVIGDSEDGKWVEVIYDQRRNKSGWVKTRAFDANPTPGKVTQTEAAQNSGQSAEPEHFRAYQTWPEFMKLNAKSSGVYWLSGVKEYNRSIRTSDRDDATLIPVTIIRDLKVRHLRGNWLLVEVLDFQHNTPIGWVRWRDDNGNLMVFPNISGQHMPIVTTAY